MTHSPMVSVVIVNYNGRAVLPQCLKSLATLSCSHFEVIVVDNASSDGSADDIPHLPGIAVLRNSVNIGYAAGVNVGISHARGEYIAILNNDTVVDQSWLQRAIPHFEADKLVWAVSSRQMCLSSPGIIDSLFLYPSTSLLLKDMGRAKPFHGALSLSKSAQVLGPGGAAGIYRAAALRQLGGYDERYFAYCEDSDIAMRAFLSGWKCIYEPQAVVFHIGSYSFNRVRASAFYYGQRNIVWFLYKFYPTAFLVRALPFVLLEEMRAVAVGAIRLRQPGVWFRARRDSMHGLAALREERRHLVVRFRQRTALFRRFMKERCIPVTR